MKLLVACHDAGGAEMVSSWILAQKDVTFVTVLSGPAKAVFKRKFGERRYGKPMPMSFAGYDFVLCGSSVKSPVEIWAWRMAQNEGTPTAVYLDHWKNYAKRFVSEDGTFSLPDEIWVTDALAAELAERELPGARILIKGNPYLDATLADISKLRYERVAKEHVLFVHEPGHERDFHHWLHRGFENGQALRERPHPSTDVPQRTLAEDVAWADTVVGYDSMALAVALFAERKVVSLLPPEKVTIPFSGIEHA